MRFRNLIKYLAFFSLIISLGSCSTVNDLGDSIKFEVECVSDPQKCTNRELCNEAVLSGEWQTRSDYTPFVKEALKRGLTCGIKANKSKNTIDRMMKQALRRLEKLNVLSSYEVKNKEKILQNMNINEYNNLYRLCKNAFANSEPSKCDNVIKALF